MGSGKNYCIREITALEEVLSNTYGTGDISTDKAFDVQKAMVEKGFEKRPVTSYLATMRKIRRGQYGKGWLREENGKPRVTARIKGKEADYVSHRLNDTVAKVTRALLPVFEELRSLREENKDLKKLLCSLTSVREAVENYHKNGGNRI